MEFKEYLEMAMSKGGIKVNKNRLKSWATEVTWYKNETVEDSDYKEFEKNITRDDIEEITGITFDDDKLEANDPEEEAKVDKVIKEMFNVFKDMINSNIKKRKSAR